MTDGVGRKWDKSTNWPGSIVLKAPLGLLSQYNEFRNRTFWKRPRLSDNGEYVRRKVITHARKKMIQLGAFYSRIYRIFAAFLCFFPRKRGAQRQGQLKACWSASHTASEQKSSGKRPPDEWMRRQTYSDVASAASHARKANLACKKSKKHSKKCKGAWAVSFA